MACAMVTVAAMVADGSIFAAEGVVSSCDPVLAGRPVVVGTS